MCKGFDPVPGTHPDGGGCRGQVLPGRTGASGPTGDGFLVLEPLAGAEVRIRPVASGDLCPLPCL